MSSLQLETVARHVQAVAINHHVWRGPLSELTELLAADLSDVPSSVIEVCLQRTELQTVLFARDVAMWRGVDGLLRLVDQSVPSDPAAALQFVTARVDGHTRICRYCCLEESPVELVGSGPGSSLHAWCRRAWYRAVRISMTATRGRPVARSWWQVLELASPYATTAEVETAYKRLAQKHHPDKGGDLDVMRSLNEARDQATDKRLKKRNQKAAAHG